MADDSQSTPVSASIPVASGCSHLSLGEASSFTSSSNGLTPAPKRTKRASKWQEAWKKYRSIT